MTQLAKHPLRVGTVVEWITPSGMVIHGEVMEVHPPAVAGPS